MQYLVAAAVYRRETDTLINRSLQVIFQTPNDWGGEETVSAAVSILQVIAATPGDDQSARIEKIMLSKAKADAAHDVTYGVGLLCFLVFPTPQDKKVLQQVSREQSLLC